MMLVLGIDDDCEHAFLWFARLEFIFREEFLHRAGSPRSGQRNEQTVVNSCRYLKYFSLGGNFSLCFI